MKVSLGAKTLLYPTPVMVVCSYDHNGRPNAMTAAWGGIVCSAPPAVGVCLRKATYSYANIERKGCFTVNIPSEDQAIAADYFGTVSGKDTDKIASAGLTQVKSEIVDAPYIAEFPLVLECRVIQKVEIGLHTMFVGEVLDVKAEQAVLDSHGRPDMARLQPIMYAPEVRMYYGVSRPVGKAFEIGKLLKKKS